MAGLTAGDVMTPKPTCVPLRMKIEELIHLFRVSHFSGVPVVDEDYCARGVISETDILRALTYSLLPHGSSEMRIPKKGQPPRDRATSRLLDRTSAPGDAPAVGRMVTGLLERSVQELMSPVTISCLASEPLDAVCETMAWKGVHRVVVVDEDKRVIGLITVGDIARSFGQYLRGGPVSQGGIGQGPTE